MRAVPCQKSSTLALVKSAKHKIRSNGHKLHSDAKIVYVGAVGSVNHIRKQNKQAKGVQG